ncbi:MAG TPA: TQO small subunit DoxD [Gemmatimonadales bacterium]|nr:TQO small subunit DoxD [Gemmatimonadales bacterium]
MRLPGEIVQGIFARGALVLLRVYLGVVFLLAALPKLQSDSGPDLAGFLQYRALDTGHAFYRPFVETALLPNSAIVASLVGGIEAFVGITLVAGLLTRFSAGLAMVLALNYMLAKGAWFWTPWSYDAAFFVVALALLVGAAGRTLGIDALLARRWPRSPLW